MVQFIHKISFVVRICMYVCYVAAEVELVLIDFYNSSSVCLFYQEICILVVKVITRERVNVGTFAFFAIFVKNRNAHERW